MKTLLILLGALCAGLVASTMGSMVQDEIRTRLTRLPYAILRLAAMLAPAAQREDLRAEWRSEASAILKETQDVPVTGLLRATWFALGLLARSRAIARELDGTAGERRRQLHDILTRIKHGTRALAGRPGGRGLLRRQVITVSTPGGSIAITGTAALAATMALTAAAAGITISALARPAAAPALPGPSAPPAPATEWTLRTGDMFPFDTTLAAGTLYIDYAGGPGPGLQAVDAATGKVRWTRAIRAVEDPVVIGVADGTVYAEADDNINVYANNVYALDAATGRLRWTSATGGNDSDVVVAGGTVYASGHGDVGALDAATCRLRWARATGGFFGPVVVAGGTVYGAGGDGHVDALDAATGRLRWTSATGGFLIPVTMPVVVAGGTVYGAGRHGHVYAPDAATGRLRWTSRHQE
jgi:hypothetical protein